MTRRRLPTGSERQRPAREPDRWRVEVVRVYDDVARHGDEYRVLVDRLWPRGLRRDAADLDEWSRDVAPSTELRRWYAHEPSRFASFARRYRAELHRPPGDAALAALEDLARHRRLVLLTATRDVEHSGATVLRDVLLASRQPVEPDADPA